MLNTLAPGFSRAAVEELSRDKGEPAWMLQKRLDAWDTYEKTPTPLGRRGDLGTLRAFSNFKFDHLTSYVPGKVGDVLPTSFEKARQEGLVDERSGTIIQHNSSIVRIELNEDLKQQGVILTDLETAVREHADLVQPYFMTDCIPVDSNKYTALHAAFWSGGIFLYVPQGVEIAAPILSQVWLDAPGSAFFSHTLIVADEMSSVRFVTEYSSGVEGEQATLLDDVVEVYA